MNATRHQAADLIARCRAEGVALRADGDKLKVTFADGVIDEAIKGELVRLKPAVLELLRAANQPPIAPELIPVLRWLHFIGENSQPIIDEVLARCRASPEAKRYYRELAQALPLLCHGATGEDGRVTCAGCRHFHPDPISPAQGIGACLAGAGQHGRPLYPPCRPMVRDFSSRRAITHADQFQKQGRGG